MILSRRSLLASLGLALPAAAVVTTAQAATFHHAHHAKRHLHAASAHPLHHAKTHRTASALRGHPRVHA